MKKDNWYILFAMLLLITGLFIGYFIAIVQVGYTLTNLVKNVKIEKVEIGFNETYIMDRFNQTASYLFTNNTVYKSDCNKLENNCTYLGGRQ